MTESIQSAFSLLNYLNDTSNLRYEQAQLSNGNSATSRIYSKLTVMCFVQRKCQKQKPIYV